MTHLSSSLYSKQLMLVLFVLFLLLALSGYRSRAADATPAATLIVGSDAGTAAVAGGTAPALEVTYGPGTFNLPAATTGLSDLASYQASLILSFKGTRAGQPQAWSRTWVMLANQKPAARQLTINTAGDLPIDATSAATKAATGNISDLVFMAEINGTQYQRQGQDVCTASVPNKENSLAATWEPAGFLTGVIGADAAGSDTVNGGAANHYTFDERALGQQGITQSKGELWVATNGGYIVKYLLATTGNANYFGDGSEGTVTWDYELTNVNQPIAIKLPKDCPAGMIDAPLLPDATNVVKQPGLQSYTTTANVADAAAFYQKQLPTLGWQVHTEASITKDSALLDFANDNQGMLVIITVADGKTTVRVVLGPAPEGTNVPTTEPTATLRPTRTPAPTRTTAPTRTKVPTRTPSLTKTKTPTRTSTPLPPTKTPIGTPAR